MHGQGEVPEAGLTLFYASTALQNQLIVVTPTLSYAISPADPAGFIESIKARYELGPTQAVTQTTAASAVLRLAAVARSGGARIDRSPARRYASCCSAW